MKSNIKFNHILVGDKIRYYRNICGLSLKQLSSKLDISAQQLQKYEKGINRITIEKLVKIANARATDCVFF